jgi:serine/threonine protein kinase
MLSVGKNFGHYFVRSTLGAGGMGEVYLAEDIRLKRQVALKILPDALSGDRECLLRFEREASAASALNHPNILTVYEIGEVSGVHYISTEFIDGKTLREKLARSGQLNLNEKLNIALQIAEALVAAHSAGIVHRDIKPENIMFRHDGYIKVLDFGLAKLTTCKQAVVIESEAKTLSKHDTAEGALMGTVAYMSPEQVRGKTVDARSDVWSLGIVMYEMFSGRVPFTGDSMNDIIASILKNEPAALSKSTPNCPAELRRIVTKTLQKNREERYQVVKDLALDLKTLKNELELSSKLEFISEQVPADKPGINLAAIANMRRFSLFHELIILFLTALTISGIWWFFLRGDKISEPPAAATLKTTEIIGWSSSPAESYSVGSFSPDGKMIAFASTKTGTKNIWVKQTASGEAVQITKDEFSNDNPIWSPNGDEIAFFSRRGNQTGIWRIPSLGGTPTLLKTVQDGNTLLKLWSKKDVIYYESKRNLYGININSKQTTQLTDFSAVNIVDNTINVSPDEERIAYIANEGEQHSVRVSSVSNGSAREIFNSPLEIASPVWHPDNKRILFSLNIEGVYQIFAADANGGSAPVQITNGSNNCFVLDVSTDGTKILYGSSKEDSDIWGINVAKLEEFPFASDTSSELWADVSPDGKTVAYQVVKNLTQGELSDSAILTKTIGSKEQPFQVAANGYLPVWSPDGKQLAFLRLENGKDGIWTINATGGQEKRLTTGVVILPDYTILPYNRLQTSSWSWSPNNEKIAYISGESQQRNIAIVHSDGTGDSQITSNQDVNLFLYCPIWSSDGKRIAHSSIRNDSNVSKSSAYAIWIIDTETKIPKQIFQSNNFLRLLGWSSTEKELIIAATADKVGNALPTEVSLIQISVENGGQHLIGNLKSTYLYNIHLSADKKNIAFATHKDDIDNLWILPSSGGEAKKITNNNDPRLYFSNAVWSPDGRAIFFGKQSRHNLLSMITNFK